MNYLEVDEMTEAEMLMENVEPLSYGGYLEIDTDNQFYYYLVDHGRYPRYKFVSLGSSDKYVVNVFEGTHVYTPEASWNDTDDRLEINHPWGKKEPAKVYADLPEDLPEDLARKLTPFTAKEIKEMFRTNTGI